VALVFNNRKMQRHVFKSHANKIKQYEDASIRYWWHERFFADSLDFLSVDGLNEFLKQAKRGGVGERPGRDDWISNPEPFNGKINVQKIDKDNELHLHMLKMGRRVATTNRHNVRQPCINVALQEEVYYLIKKFSESNSSEFIPLTKQIEIIKEVTGIKGGLNEEATKNRQVLPMRSRRKEEHVLC